MNAFLRLAVLTLSLAAGLVPAREPLRIESSLDAMGSVFTIVAYAEDRNLLQTAVDHSFEEVRRLDDLLSNYKPRSEWSRVNRDAAARPAPVSPELFRLLEQCIAYSRETDGAFDITVGPLLRVWGFYKGTGRLPHRAEIRVALAKAGYRKILLDASNHTVRFAASGTEIDPGGIGKGYAVDRVVEVLRGLGIGSALVSAGGSSIYGLGTPPGQKGWKVQIRHPRRPAEHVAEVVLNNHSMSTSGASEKFFVSGGRTYSHIFDPATGFPAEGMLSVSVLAPGTLDSEAWTKPAFIRGKQWTSKRLPGGLRAHFCEDRINTPCAWLQ